MTSDTSEWLEISLNVWEKVKTGTMTSSRSTTNPFYISSEMESRGYTWCTYISMRDLVTQGEDLSLCCWTSSCLKRLCWNEIPFGTLLWQLIDKKYFAIDLNRRWSMLEIGGGWVTCTQDWGWLGMCPWNAEYLIINIFLIDYRQFISFINMSHLH